MRLTEERINRWQTASVAATESAGAIFPTAPRAACNLSEALLGPSIACRHNQAGSRRRLLDHEIKHDGYRDVGGI